MIDYEESAILALDTLWDFIDVFSDIVSSPSFLLSRSALFLDVVWKAWGFSCLPVISYGIV